VVAEPLVDQRAAHLALRQILALARQPHRLPEGDVARQLAHGEETRCRPFPDVLVRQTFECELQLVIAQLQELQAGFHHFTPLHITASPLERPMTLSPMGMLPLQASRSRAIPAWASGGTPFTPSPGAGQ